MGPESRDSKAVDTPGPRETQRLSNKDEPEVICGRYRRIKLLGRGAFGCVWQCHDQVTGIDVAIKQLPPKLADDPAQVETIRSNFQAVERLHHPNIAAAKTLEVDPGSGECFFVMEFVDGMELNRLLLRHDNRMPLDEVIGIARQVATALDFCHSRHIIHRDIKPGNIIVDKKGVVKVLDFGLAEAFATRMASITREQATEYMTIGGTCHFMPPEQWKGQRMDGRTDQYALAATVYKLLSGTAPFESAPNVTALMAAVEHEPVPPIEGLDQRAWTALEKALSKRREERFDTCTAFVDACTQAPVSDPPWWRRKSRLILIGATCAALALASPYVARKWHGSGQPSTDRSAALLPESSSKLVYHGLVIGINDYRENEGWPDLENARRDAEDLADVLRSRYGFQSVEMLLDREATRGRILQKIEDMALSRDVNDAVLIYFAGHGEYSQELDEGYWVPADGTRREYDEQAKAGWIKNLEITSLMEASDARHVLVVADSCYAGALSRRSSPVTAGVQTNTAANYSRMLNRSSRYVIASGEHWEQAYDSGVSNSPFAHYLLNALKHNTNRWMSAYELAEAIRAPYHQHTGNTIRVGPLLRKGCGQFVFETGEGAAEGTIQLAAKPAPVLSDHPLLGYAMLTRSGRTNAAVRLLRKLPEDLRTAPLLTSVTDYFDVARRQSRRQRLDEMIEYLRRNPPAPDPLVQKALEAFAKPRVLVVLGPEDQSHNQRGKIDETIWRSGLTEFLRSAGGLRVFDRDNLDDALFEIKLSASNASDQRARSLVGELLPASLLVTGEVFSEGNTSRVFLRLLAAESAEILGAFESKVNKPEELAREIEVAAGRIHARALSARPLRAKVIQADADTMQAAVGWFHGARTDSRFELLRRIRQEHVLFEEYREERVGTARVKYLGENTLDLDPQWAETVTKEQYDALWVRELMEAE